MTSKTNEKSSDCPSEKFIPRFPENHSNKNDRNNNAEIQPHHSWANERDSQPIDRKMPSQFAKSTTNIRNISSDLPPTVPPKRTHLSSHPNALADDSLSNPLKNYMSNNKSIVTKESHTSVLVTTHNTVAIDSKIDQDGFLKSVLQKGEYFNKYGRWHEFRGPEEVRKCPGKVIERNENIWEIVYNEYKYVEMLGNIRNVYCLSYPHISVGNTQHASSRGGSSASDSSRVTYSEPKDHSSNLFESIDTILPGIDRMIEYHAKICNVLIENHVIRPDRVITEIGRVLHESIPDEFIPVLSELYGSINFAKVFINEKLSMFKKYPEFYSYINKCENDPRMDKKKLSDILLVMSTHLSKTVTTVMSITNNTINDTQEMNNLMNFKDKIGKIINGASNYMDRMMNMKWLKGVIENYEITPDMEDSERAYKFMVAYDAKLLFNGKVHFELKKGSNGRPLTREVHGVALEECMFFLQAIQEPGRSQPKYQLFKDRDSSFPALLQWGELYGYFREDDTKCNDSYYFYVIIEKPAPSIVRLSVGPLADRSYWKQYMMQGFSRWQSESSDITEAENKLSSDLKKIKRKWSNTQFGIELIKNLDNSLRVQLEYRTVGFRCLLEEELKRLSGGSNAVNVSDNSGGNSFTAFSSTDQVREDLDANDSACTETFLPDLTTKEGIQDWLELFIEWVNRLKFSLCSSGANITRSASEIEARKRPSIPTVKKCETFSSRDSANNEKRQTDVTFLNPTITKQKKEQRRISVSGFTNLFRINSKNVKHDETDRVNDSVLLPESNIDHDKDESTLENLVMISEADCFLMGLSKDTVMAFNEINVAAKNITIELLNLRSKNVALEADLKKTQEENQSYCEFLKKYHKSIDSQSASVSGNNGHQKSDSVNLALLGSHLAYDSVAEGAESLNDNSAGMAHINQKLIDCKRQTENLREMYKQFEIEKKKWEKEYETQRIKVRNDQDSIFQKTLNLNAEKEALQKKEQKYTEKCKTLQDNSDKITATQIAEKEDLLEREKQYIEKCKVLKDTVEKINKKYNLDLDHEHLTLPNTKLNQILQNDSSHSRSHSDDASHKTRNSKMSSSGLISPPLASTEASSYNADTSRHIDPMHNSNVPDQLKGSLINQRTISNQYSTVSTNSERQSLKINSSDNTLEVRSKSSNKLTPSTDRKDNYSTRNTCYERDDTEDGDFCSDVDDSPTSSDRVIKSTIVETKHSVSTVVNKTTIVTDNNKPGARASVITHAASSESGANKPSSLGIPVGLATKSKVKPKKTK